MMTESNEITKKAELEREESDQELIEIGQWYWIVENEDDEDGEESEDYTPWLACVTEVGSNFAEVHSPTGSYTRIHLDDWKRRTRREFNYKEHISGKIEHYKNEVNQLVEKARDITKRLGVNEKLSLVHEHVEESTQSLAVCNSAPDIGAYKNELIKAKDEDLPKIFEDIRKASDKLATWMKADLIPLRAYSDSLKGSIKKLEGKIFNVSLYSGLTEQVEQIKDGVPADYSEKIRLMQRLVYMDEECLLNYKHGGMEFGDIHEFDDWLMQPENLDRLIPFPRCIVAFQVRRNRKERYAGTLWQAFVNIDLEDADKLTFLYIRNGDKLFRMNCDLDFRGNLFPDKNMLNLTEPMVFRRSHGDDYDFMTVREYEDLRKKHAEDMRVYRKLCADRKKWREENPDKLENDCPFPYPWAPDNPTREYQPFNDSNVYFDEASKGVSDRVEKYNRIALIIQGLLDRSPILHPHPPARLWTPEGFNMMIELIYDGSNTLPSGFIPPDFEKYKAELAKQIRKGSVTIGQGFYRA